MKLNNTIYHRIRGVNMRHRIYVFCISCLSISQLQGQKQDFNWMIHYFAPPNYHRPMMRFHSGQVDTTGYDFRFYISQFKAMISDRDGNFRFLSDGFRIYDRNFELVENSFDLVPGEYSAYFDKAGSRLTQGGIMLPIGEDEEDVILLHQSSVGNLRCEMQDCESQLYYTRVDGSANEGKGRVIEKGIRIADDTLFTGMVSACRHANERDWWVIVWRKNTNEYMSILVDKSGVSVDHRASIGNELHWKANGNTQSVFSPDGSKYAYFNPRSGLHMYDFDRETGRLSRFRRLEIPFRHSLGGCVFSPNSRFLYLNTNIHMYQLDTEEEFLENGLFQLENYEWEWAITRNWYPPPYNQGQLAPDCKIYYSTGYVDSILHVIHKPDEKGKACDFQQRAYNKIYWVGFTVPNFPHFRMGEDMERHCALVNQISAQPIHSGTRLALWPNPASDQMAIRLDPIPPRGLARYAVYSISGKLVASGIVSDPDNQIISLHGMAAGIYIIDIQLPDAAPIIERFVKR